MQEPENWREVLIKRIKDPRERTRLAQAMEINAATLVRWAHGDSNPRAQNLRNLLQLLPEYRTTFANISLDEADDSEFPAEEPENVEIPSIFYARVLNAHCNLPKVIHFNSLCDVILQQAIKQLDPQRLGMEITVVECMKPGAEGKVLSLREKIGQATPPWNRDAEAKILFLGAESLAGFVVSSGRALAIESRQEGMHLFPVRWEEWEQSAMAYPIMRSDHVAGCLMVSSARPKYFTAPGRQKLIQYYAELLSIVFEPEAFYPLRKLELGHMPALVVQIEHIASFRQRTAQKMLQSQLSSAEAEQLAWHDIEEELLRDPSSFTDS